MYGFNAPRVKLITLLGVFQSVIELLLSRVPLSRVYRAIVLTFNARIQHYVRFIINIIYYQST